MFKKLLLTALLAISPAFAADKNFFDIADFEKAQAANKRIFVEVFAPWCPTCKVQAPIIQKLMNLPENATVTTFIVDFDTQKDELKYLKARSQSTLIMYKGKVETARTSGDTTDAGIAKLINSSK